MGTNFYTKNGDKHLGKRSAAGLFCWDCGITLCKEGPEQVHKGHRPHEDYWHKACPKCRKRPPDRFRLNSSLTPLRPGEGVGVNSCCSWTWATDPTTLEELLWAALMETSFGKVIRNEYGEEFTYDEFLIVVRDCPIHFTDNIGLEFG